MIIFIIVLIICIIFCGILLLIRNNINTVSGGFVTNLKYNTKYKNYFEELDDLTNIILNNLKHIDKLVSKYKNVSSVNTEFQPKEFTVSKKKYKYFKNIIDIVFSFSNEFIYNKDTLERFLKKKLLILYSLAEIQYIFTDLNSKKYNALNFKYINEGGFNIIYSFKYESKEYIARVAFKHSKATENDYIHYLKKMKNIKQLINNKNNKYLIVKPLIWSFDAPRIECKNINIYYNHFEPFWIIENKLKEVTKNIKQSNKINLIQKTIKCFAFLLQNDYLFLDWKLNNFMIDNNHYVISDIDFIKKNSTYGACATYHIRNFNKSYFELNIVYLLLFIHDLFYDKYNYDLDINHINVYIKKYNFPDILKDKITSDMVYEYSSKLINNLYGYD